MEKIFISYSLNESKFAESISNYFSLKGFEIYLNDPILSNSNDYRNELRRKITQSDIFIIIFSRIKDDRDMMFLSNELEYITGYINNNESNKLLIPIIHEDAQESIFVRELFSRYRTLTYSSRSKIDEINAEINRILNVYLGKVTANKEKDTAIREKIESTSAEYIQETIKELQSRETKLSNTATRWYIVGYISIIMAILFSGLFYFIFIYKNTSPTIIELIFSSFKSLLIIILFIAAAKYSFDLAKSYMNEAMKNSDRIHAISFGKFYMQVFERNVKPDEIMKVFQYWNINGTSSFSNLSTKDFDPNIIEQAVKLIEVAKELKTNDKLSDNRK